MEASPTVRIHSRSLERSGAGVGLRWERRLPMVDAQVPQDGASPGDDPEGTAGAYEGSMSNGMPAKEVRPADRDRE